jgi:hypothetical protein
MALKAHVGFSIPEIPGIEVKIISHFSGLGYRLVEKHPSKWIFQRGSKSSAFFRFDIRSYSTILTICTNPNQDGMIWVSCDWEVWTFMTITTGGDVTTLESEGYHLETLLRQVATTD